MEYTIGDIFTDDEEYSLRADFCNKNNLMIVELEKVDGERRFQIQEIPPLSDKELNENELVKLKKWFNNVYSYKEQKYRRLVALNKKEKILIDGVETEIDANDLLTSLYAEAEEKRERIQELESLVEEE